MSMTANAIRFYTDSERLAYQKIDGMNEVLRATPSELEDISTKYPDAMFAIMIHEINKLQDLTFQEKVFKPVRALIPELYWSNQTGIIVQIGFHPAFVT